MKIKVLKMSLLTVVIAAMAALAGCGGQPVTGKAELNVVTSFYPMYIATLNVTQGIEGVSVSNMTKPQTGCLHDYQLLPDDLKTLEKADVFVINGAGMEAFVDKVVQQRKNLRIVDASRGIELLQDGNEVNPHVWVSVTNAIKQAENIAEQLAALDQVNAARYKDNAGKYVAKLRELKRAMHGELDALPRRDVVTFHEAFPYFAREFKLNIVEVVEREPGGEPSSREIEATIAKVRDANVKALFVEPQYPKGAADIIARETGAVVYTLDPIVTGEADANAADDYIKKMRENGKALREALR